MMIVITTVANEDEGKALARKLVEEKLAACVQVLPQMTSIYRWKGKVEADKEFLLLIKTLPEQYDRLEAFISENHSYETPEIVAVEAARVSEAYGKWLSDSLS